MNRARVQSRDHDIVLWGATGFTGRLVAEHLVGQLAATGVRLALGGRDADRLEAIRRDLTRISPAASELPLIVADSHDRASLDAMAAAAGVVCSTVGPYAVHGHELVAACVDRDTDYCDLTGEVQFIRRMIDRHHDRARASGTRIVHCCGFDSIPSDLGTLVLQESAIDRHGAPFDDVTFVLGASRGGFSGGTVASLVNVLDEAASDRSVRRVLTDPYALNPPGERHGPDGPDQSGPRFDRELGRWTGPFIMAAINTRIVRRTNALLDWRYGRDFGYREVTGFGPGLTGRLAATAAAGGIGALVGALAWGPTRSLLLKTLLPSPGDGPDRAARERGFFTIDLHGRRASGTGDAVTGRVRVHGDHDPGYGETSRMLGESALCLALDGAELDSPGGVLTPAAAMGLRLVDRLRRVGMVFDVS
ncbi:MAG: saccharopine dehydrogenase NADP-binding domain-containing protein [Holophagae bacterium]|jgi:short subunit dehydrogenase-like uncharacterized protein